ncbi:MAG: SDR family oxidoreductase, partial [Dehalococcoidia bacterium]|nr:SDR family oxidoreductase [Dehalococcoidia bacterium]
GVPTMAYRADVGRAAEVRAMVDAVARRFGRLDTLVNNAATTRFVSWDEVDDELWERVLAVNLSGAYYCIRAVTPHMREAGMGVIVNVSSIGGLTPAASSAPYAVSKAGLNHLTRFAARHLGPVIRVNAVAPGLVLTRWNADRPSEAKEAQIQAAALKMPGLPEDIANAVLFLSTDESRFITGQVLVVDGGRVMQ